jgi:hypothetical protein
VRRESGLLHPVALLAIAVLVVNDHVLKAAWPGVITGKLSDFAGLVFFPLLVAAPWRRQRAVDLACALTGLGFALVKLWEPATSLCEHVLGIPYGEPVAIVRDATDLLALPMLAVARWCYRTVGR